MLAIKSSLFIWFWVRFSGALPKQERDMRDGAPHPGNENYTEDERKAAIEALYKYQSDQIFWFFVINKLYIKRSWACVCSFISSLFSGKFGWAPHASKILLKFPLFCIRISRTSLWGRGILFFKTDDAFETVIDGIIGSNFFLDNLVSSFCDKLT